MPNAKLTKQIVKDYDPAHTYLLGNSAYNWRRRIPFYRSLHVPPMLEDYRVRMSLMILKGMVTSLAKFKIEMGEAEGEHGEVLEFLKKQVTRFWMSSADAALTAMEWGWHGSEVLYRVTEDGKLSFDGLQAFRALDVRPVSLDGALAGIELHSRANAKYIGGEKAFWHVQGRDHNRFWGVSRLRPAFEPWLEKHDEFGALDVRRLHYYKHVLQSDVIRYPEGATPDTDGNLQSHRDHARQIAEHARTGGAYVLPSTTNEHGKHIWDITSLVHTGQSAIEIREYCADLDREITEGIGLSEELFQAAESGSGYSGRKIPEQATRGMLQRVVYELITDADQQIFRPLVRRNFGYEPDYEIVPFGLIEEDQAPNQQAGPTPPKPEPNQLPQPKQ